MTRNTDQCVSCRSGNLFSGFFDRDDLAVSDDSGEGTRWTTFCNECGPSNRDKDRSVLSGEPRRDLDPDRSGARVDAPLSRNRDRNSRRRMATTHGMGHVSRRGRPETRERQTSPWDRASGQGQRAVIDSPVARRPLVYDAGRLGVTLVRHPSRRAVCPHCGKTIVAYVPTAHVESIDGPRRYIFRSHTTVDRTRACEGWAARVPDDAFLDGKSNIDV